MAHASRVAAWRAPHALCVPLPTQCTLHPQLSTRVSGARPLAAVQQLAPSAQQDDLPPLQLVVRPAVDPAELRAAAYLRATSFYTYPPGRSEWAERSHRRMKADAEWEAVTAKVEGRDETYKNVQVTAFIGMIPDEPACEVAQQVSVDMDLSAKLPSPGPGQPPSLVVATLDMNLGRNLPAEELQGRLPAPEESDANLRGDPTTQRAYLSNVCVSKGARRRGVARQLIESVEAQARSKGVKFMYVHVVYDNTAAVQLYKQALGYQVESEESGAFARAAARPRRLLLCKRL